MTTFPLTISYDDVAATLDINNIPEALDGGLTNYAYYLEDPNDPHFTLSAQIRNLLCELAPRVRVAFNACGLHFDDDGFTLDRDITIACVDDISRAIQNAYNNPLDDEMNILWDHFALSGNDDVDYNGLHPSSFCAVIRYYLDHRS